MIEYQFGTQHSSPPANFYQVTQIHSNKNIYINHHSQQSVAETKCDAMISAASCTLLIKTADCLPILAFNDSEIAAIHAGWRGLKDHIVTETLSGFKTPPHTIVIGPHIRECCFEVHQDCATMILDSLGKTLDAGITTNIVSPLNENKYRLDLEGILRFQLRNIWDGKIVSIPDCTCCNENYASYRRDRTNLRNYSWITKKGPTARR